MTSAIESDEEPLQNLLAPERVARDPEDATQRPVSPWVLVAVSVGLMAACFGQSPGRLAQETSLTLALQPVELMGRALHLWQPGFQFGQLVNQTWGYLFPIGPFFAIASWLHVPAWWAQRLWVGFVFIAAFWGLVRLSEAMSIGTRWSRVIGGVVYCLAPWFVVQGGNPAAMMPGALLPWIMLPLVRSSVEGLPRRAAARSGVAIALIGGVNVAATLAVLPAPLLYLLTRKSRPRGLLSWWLVAVALANFLWVVPLILQGHYGLNFLPFEETARTTTSTASASEALLGTSGWLNFYHLGASAIPAGWTLVSVPVALAGTVLIVGVGLSGLALRRIPERFFLVLVLSLGMVLVAAGYGGHVSGVFGAGYRSLIDGPAAAFRNISKFEPLIALPLAMGLVHILGLPALRQLPAQWLRVLLAALAVAVLAAAVILPAPFIRDQLFPSTFQLPTYWQSAANWLNQRAGDETSLLLPASANATYNWGQPNAEPFDSLLHTPWAVLNVIPLGSVGSIRLMQAVENSLDSGYPANGLADYLARAGIGYLVVRNDLNLSLTGAPPPNQVAAVLRDTPGIRLVKQFGPRVPGDATSREVEIFKVERPVEVVHAYPQRDPVILSGGPDSLLSMANAGLLDSNRATLLAGDIGASRAARARGSSWVVTDTVQYVDTDFGSVRDNTSYPLTPGELSPDTGKPPQQFLVVPGIAHQTVAMPIGAAGVTSSSYGSSGFVLSPAEGPASAFDNDPSSIWVANAADNSVGQWVSINFGRSVPLTAIIVSPLDDGPFRPRVEKLRITTQRGSVVRDILPGETPQILRVPQGRSRWMRLTIERVAAPTVNPGLSGAGLRDVAIPGVTFQMGLSVPSDEAKAFSRPGANVPTYLFSSPINNAAYSYGTANPVEAHLVRSFTVPRAAVFALTGTVTPRLGSALDAVRPPLVAPDSPFVLPCGQGPPIDIDGVSIPTQVSGTVKDLLSLSPLQLTSCRVVPLSAGRHLVAGVDDQGPFRYTTLVVRDAAIQHTTVRSRSVSVKGFSGDNPEISIGPGSASYVALASNFNSGWAATLNGDHLRPVRIDGWQQGWAVPAGHGGTILVTYSPDHLYRITLLLGLLLLAGLFVLALVPSRYRRSSNPVAVGWVPPGVVFVAGSAAVLLLLGGPVVLALPPAIVVARVWPRLLPWVVAAAIACLGVVLVLQAGAEPNTGQGAFGVTAQVCTLVALAAVLGGVCEAGISSGWWWKPRAQTAQHVRDTSERTRQT
jgi:arabinofuranan 3-O-arabinosyltransferase